MRVLRKLTLVLPLALGLLGVQALAQRSSLTAAMVEIHTGGTSGPLAELAIVDGGLYGFNRDAIGQYFQNVYVGHGGYVCLRAVCVPPSSYPQPPDPDPSKLWMAGANNECSTMEGDELQSASYQQSVQDNRYKYIFNYALVPTVNALPPLTGWSYLGSAPEGTASVSVAPTVAIESASARGSHSIYSFALLNEDGSEMLDNLALSVDGGTPQPVGHSARSGASFTFSHNAGMLGTTSLLRNGDAVTILNSDSTRENDNGGPGGMYLSQAAVSPAIFHWGVGFHSLQLTGTVLGDSPLSFRGSQSVRIIGPNSQFCR